MALARLAINFLYFHDHFYSFYLIWFLPHSRGKFIVSFTDRGSCIDNIQPTTRITVPVIALSFIRDRFRPFNEFITINAARVAGLDSNLSSWLASAFYAGLWHALLLM